MKKLLLLLTISSAICIFLNAKSKPNILFIFSDDHGLRTIGAYNPQFKGTPNIDRIADSGAVFTRSYCENSICQPSRAAVLTGKVSAHHGVVKNGAHWDNKQQIFTRLIKKAGYQTAMIGKWHMHPLPSDEFDYHKTLTANAGQGRYYNPAFVEHDGSIKIEEGYSTDVIASESIEWMKNADKEKPFMMMCQFKAPHTNVMPPIRNLHMYKDEDVFMPETYFDNYQGRNPYVAKSWMKMHGMKSSNVVKISPPIGEYQLPTNAKGPERNFKGDFKYLAEMNPEQRKKWHEHYDPENEDYRARVASGELTGNNLFKYRYQRYMKDYLRVVSAIDQNVGRLLDFLDASGLAENTIVIYSSDQGFFLGEHGWSDKRLMYEESFQMPFVIKWPNQIKPGSRINHMIQNIDYAPTFLDIAGLKIPSDMQGRSLLPLLRNEPVEDWRDSVYYHYYHNGAYNLPKIEGARTDRYKLIRYYDHKTLNYGEQWELFDLKKDPQEMSSVFDDPEYSIVRNKMEKELIALRTQYGIQ